MSQPIIAVENMSKGFVNGTQFEPLFRNISLSIGQGEFVALTGTTGCGKSTLMNMIGGLDRPDEGRVLVKDTEIGKLSGAKRARFLNKHVGFIFQSHHLLPEQTALANVMLPMRIGGWRTQQAQERATELLTKLGLGARLEARPTTLSGGEKQRVAIARGLATRPEVLLADEPTGSLNPQFKEEVFKSLIDISRSEGATVVMVTHDVALIQDGAGGLRIDRMIDVAKLRNSTETLQS